MFCSKCGTQLADGATSCPNCSTPVKSAPTGIVQPRSVSSFNFKDPKFLGIVGAVVVVFLLFSMLFGGQSYKGAVNNFMEGVFESDGKQLLKAFPDKVIDQMCEDADMSKKELSAYINDELSEAFDELEYYAGSNWSIKHKITGTEKYDSDDLKWIKEEYREIGVKVKDAKIVTVEMTVKAAGMSQTLDMEIGVIKVGGSWYVDAQNVDMPF